ncbi:hypothetical protein QTH91_01515 [Variovorax dokdonensis]|uniref:Transmembrane protein n=1 Tax=Variovorax dokdonensis TaxID=344883 RepID=A0ABT7N5F4_9BURK|nr:hypothetical protein [Variovorax dokdonensis]MDM0043148.1 hypothetical protein [Variovorax dokdonensis]
MEFGDLARHAGNQMTQLRALGFLMGSIVGLAMMVRTGVVRAQTRYLSAAIILCVSFFFAGLWWIYYSGAGPQWMAGALAFVAYLSACFVICLIAWVIAKRRHNAIKAAMAQRDLERSHHQRLEALRSEAAGVRDTRGNAEPDDEDGYSLPKRPKWDDPF